MPVIPVVPTLQQGIAINLLNLKKKPNMKKFVSENILTIAGVLVGAIAGYLYWKFIGCSTGNCAITSKPFNSTAYGALMGGLFFSMLKKDKSKTI